MTSLLLTTEAASSFFNVSSDYNFTDLAKNFTCSPELDDACEIDHTMTCIGDPLYCNLTKDEYIALLEEYIYPTVPEWILIFSHALVFFMGLVSAERNRSKSLACFTHRNWIETSTFAYSLPFITIEIDDISIFSHFAKCWNNYKAAPRYIFRSKKYPLLDLKMKSFDSAISQQLLLLPVTKLFD